MPSRSEAGLLAIFVLLLTVGGATPAVAAETTSSEIVIVRPEDVVEDDLYAAAVRVIVEGEVDGDLIVFAAENLVVTGEVTGSVIAVAPTVRIEGTVGGSVRAVATTVELSGTIGDDLVLVALDAALEAGSRVAGDALAWASELETHGVIVGDLGGTQRRLRLGGAVQGEVEVSVGSLLVAEGASVTGDLTYRSADEAVGIERAEVGGSVVHRSPLPPNIRVRALGLLGRLLVILLVALSALVITYLWPERTRAAADRLTRSPVGNWFGGAAIFFSPLILLGIGALIFWLAPPAAALPLVVILLPMVLALTGVVLVTGLAAAAPTSVMIGARISGKLHLFAAALVGALVAGVLWLLPIVGWLVPVVLLPWGLGGWLRSSGGRPVIDETSA